MEILMPGMAPGRTTAGFGALAGLFQYIMFFVICTQIHEILSPFREFVPSFPGKMRPSAAFFPFILCTVMV
jgi:hypothetical protein